MKNVTTTLGRIVARGIGGNRARVYQISSYYVCTPHFTP